MDWLPSPAQHFAITAIALLVYVLTTRVSRMRRPPTSAIAWVTGLALIPYLFLPLFLLFGSRKLRVARPPRATRSSGHKHWAQALIDSFACAPAAPATVRFHKDGAESRAALLKIIEGARYTLDVSTFLVGNDAIGRDVVARLEQRAKEGVRVRLMFDDAGAWLQRPPSLKSLRRAGGVVAVFNRLLGLRRNIPRNLRNHRKLIVADDRWMWAGGRNLAVEYFESTVEQPAWIDLSFDLTGPTATAAARQFDLDWVAAGGTARQDIARDIPSAGESDPSASRAQYVPSGPDQAEDTVHTLLLAACYQAKHRLIAVTPYFVPDDALLEALRLAALRGVRVTLIVPRRSNHRLTDFVRARALRALGQAGAEVRMVHSMVHAKALVVDDSVAWCGSANLDSRSLLINYESIVVFYGPREIEWLADWMTGLAQQGEHYEARPVGLARDLAEGLLLTLAFQM